MKTGVILAAGALVLAATPCSRAHAQFVPQADSVRRAALVVAQTRPDSARAMMRRLLATVPTTDSIFPGVLLTAARVATDAPTVATYLQRVIIEYGRSVWADSALLLLAQLDFAQGDPAATTQAVERMRRDYPDSPLRARVAFWGARAYFDMKDDAHGCVLVQEALAGAGDDVEFKNQVAYYSTRCAGVAPPPPPRPPVAAGTDSAARGATSYSVQVLAVKSAPQVDDVLSRLKVMGFNAKVVRDTSGLFKVRVGPYPTRDGAQEALGRLKTKLGGQPFIVEGP